MRLPPFLVNPIPLLPITPHPAPSSPIPPHFSPHFSPQNHIEQHHQQETDGEAYGAHIRVATFLRLGYQFLDHDIHHRSGGKRQQIGKYRQHHGRKQNSDCGGNRFDDAAQRADDKRFAAAVASHAQRHRHYRPFRKVLYRDTQRESKRRSHRQKGVMLQRGSKRRSYRHTFRNIM